MNMRKFFTKIVLTITAFFWAGCDDNSSSSPEYIRGELEDCDADDVSCGGGMIALYGVAPVFDESSSSVTSSDSCEQGCDEMISSSSAEVMSSSAGKVDSVAAFARGEDLCEEHGGVGHAIQYEPPWGSAEMRGSGAAESDVADEIAAALQSGKLSSKKKQCLEDVRMDLLSGMAAMYGCPLFDNPNDIWKYYCKDGTLIMDDQYKKLYDEDMAEVEVAKQKRLSEIQKKVDECGGLK